MIKREIVFIILFPVLALWAVFSFGGSDPSSGLKPVVTATVFPVYDITRNITGDLVDVQLLLPPGASSHTFDATPSAMKSITKAEVVYAIGHGLDNWVAKLASDSRTDILVVDAGVALHESMQVHSHDLEEDLTDNEPIHGHKGSDPHYWLDVKNAMQITQTIEEDLRKRFPKHAERFKINTNAYLTQLQKLDQELQKQFPEDGHLHMVTMHNAWVYFAKAFDIQVVGTFEPSAGREPTPRYLAELMHTVEDAGTTVIYSEPQISSSALEAFIDDNGLELRVLDPIGGVDGRMSYIEMMRYNVATVTDSHH